MKQYKIIFVEHIDEIENAINYFIAKRPEYDLKNIKITNEKILIIFEKYKS